MVKPKKDVKNIIGLYTNPIIFSYKLKTVRMMNYMNEEIFQRLQRIFLIRFNIDLKSKSTIDYDKHLLGKAWGLEPRDLLSLFLDIESQFSITISEKEIEKGNFSSINNLVRIIAAETASILALE